MADAGQVRRAEPDRCRSATGTYRGASRMNFLRWLGGLLGLDNVKSVESVEASFAAPWASRAPAWVFFACLALIAAAIVVYIRYQPGKHRTGRIGLAVVRALALSLLVVMLADPVLTMKLTSSPRPQLWFLFDGTESMSLQDKLPDAERARISMAAGLPTDTSATPLRIDYVRSWLQKKDGNLLARLGEKYRLRAFIFDGPDGVRSLAWQAGDGDTPDPAKTATLLTTTGQVTALGKAFEDLAQRRATTFPAGVVVVSDFDHNSGPAPLDMAKRLGVPVYTIGVGPTAVVDLAIDLQAPPVMKKSERSSIVVTLRQTGLEGQKVPVTVRARRLGGTESQADAAITLPVGQKDVELRGPTQALEMQYTPEQTGRFEFIAEVPVLSGEVVDQNNRATREVNIRDDFLRLLYVEYEPTWEWRFIKEVFHRDPLVGERGFRTFLRSSDPRVRHDKGLFRPVLTPPRSEFFANDVIFLGDMPAETLNQRFGEMVKEFVGKFGGGLVIISGPRYGPGQLAGTPLAEMLPVIADADSRRQDRGEFQMRLTSAAGQFDFMQLGNDETENQKAWANLGPLPWYQPVTRLHPLATVLAEHPTDRCADGKTPQPLIAVRRYGRGEVVYLGFDETWRLRRRYGEQYYRQFWGQLMHRLGLSHALGTQKRFVVRTDRPQYQVDDKVTVTVEAYDSNFEPLADDRLTDRKLTGQLLPPVRAGEKADPQRITLGQLREGVFEARLPVSQSGEHTVRVKDPVTGEMSDVSFRVASLSLERRSAARNVALQSEIAQATGGAAYDLETADRLPEEIHALAATETSIKVLSLWDTWLGFAMVVGLLIGEWLFRKMIHLP
jgi:hypothetical protein